MLRKMERIELSDESDEDYLEYRVIHKDGSKSFVSLRLSELDETHHMAYQLRGEVLPMGSRIAELFLYPHSETSSRRKGVGSRVLDYILEDAADRDIKLVFCEVTNQVAKSFFHKKLFKGGYNPHCYIVV